MDELIEWVKLELIIDNPWYYTHNDLDTAYTDGRIKAYKAILDKLKEMKDRDKK